jgi:hypothetical protein
MVNSPCRERGGGSACSRLDSSVSITVLSSRAGAWSAKPRVPSKPSISSMNTTLGSCIFALANSAVMIFGVSP